MKNQINTKGFVGWLRAFSVETINACQIYISAGTFVHNRTYNIVHKGSEWNNETVFRK